MENSFHISIGNFLSTRLDKRQSSLTQVSYKDDAYP